MSVYYRPIPQIDPVRPEGAAPIAGGWTWFHTLERLERGGQSALIDISQAPADVVARISAPRAPMAGLDMTRPNIMGILNVTPDSFSDGGKFDALGAGVAHAHAMQAAGADIVDIGGESTRPGAKYVEIEHEITRTAPVIAEIRKSSDMAISIDTRKAPVGQAAVDAGASLINDVAAFEFDPDLMDVAAKSGLPVCLMHSQGTPDVMQDDPRYADVVLDIYDYLAGRIAAANAAGIPSSKIMIDPGIGFGKTQAHNVLLLRKLSIFHSLGCPILLGASRKRFIGAIGGADEAQARMPGSVAVAMAAVSQGVQVLRVHDVAETHQALALHMAVTSG